MELGLALDNCDRHIQAGRRGGDVSVPELPVDGGLVCICAGQVASGLFRMGRRVEEEGSGTGVNEAQTRDSEWPARVERVDREGVGELRAETRGVVGRQVRRGGCGEVVVVKGSGDGRCSWEVGGSDTGRW
jgi:hypothetical protein